MPTNARVVVAPKDPGPLRVVETVIPDPAPHQVVVRQYASGICHSQLHEMHRSKPGPVILGHESTGTVVACGSAVTHVKEGDDVMVTWVPRDALHASRVPQGVTLKAEGEDVSTWAVFTWADVTIADEQYVVKMPREAKKDVTAIIGCAVMTGSGAVYHTAGVKRGESVAIYGVGGVGLSAIAAAAVVGANPIIAVDLDDQKLEFARQFGATHLVNASHGDPVAKIHELTPGSEMSTRGDRISGADYAFDCIGVRVTMEQILPSVRRGVMGKRSGGTAVLVGVPQTKVELDASDILGGEKKYIGSVGGSCHPDEDFPMFLSWYADGSLKLDEMVTARYQLDQINEATDALASGKIAGRAIIDLS